MGVGLEYKQTKKKEPPFLTFLKYTDEKEKSAEVVSVILGKIKSGQSLLDIGAGNADYLLLILKNMGMPEGLQTHLLEPSEDLVSIIQDRKNDFPDKTALTIISKSWETYTPTQKYDYILASHLYHLDQKDYYRDFKKMVANLSVKGKLIFILRNIDDTHEFKKTYKPLLFDKDFNPKILEETIPTFERLAKEYNLDLKRHSSISHLDIPIDKNEKDTKNIVEFFLNTHWSDIPTDIQHDALCFIEKKRGRFKQIDGILEITRL